MIGTRTGNGKVRHGLQARVAVLLLVAVLAPTALLGLIAYLGLDAVRQQARRERTALALSVAGLLDHRLRESLEQLAAVPWGADPATRHEALRAASRRTSLFQGALLIDAAGRVVDEDAIGSTRPFDVIAIQHAMATNRPATVTASRVASGDAALFAVVPLHDAQGRVAGAAIAAWDPEAALRIPGIADAASAVGCLIEIVDEQATVVATSARQALLVSSVHAPLVARWLATGRPGASESGDLVAYAPLEVLPWGVVLVEPMSGALAPIDAMTRRFVLFIPVFVVLAAIYAWGVARSVKRPLANLGERVAAIADGELAFPVPVTGDDEVAELARSVERMRQALQSSMEQLRRANADLDRRVDERTRELHALYDELSSKEEIHRKLLHKAISAQEAERKRIARELHDETCQTLTVLAMRLELASRAPDAEARTGLLDEAKQLAGRGVDELHRVIYDLRPSVLDDLGLIDAIHWLAERHLASHGIRVRLETDEIEDRIPVEIEIALFRAAQEAITNVARHANADAVWIQVTRRGSTLEVEVEDDGEGFDPSTVTMPSPTGRGLGLLGMQERVEMLGGTATIESSSGGGTRILLSVPFSRKKSDG